MTEVAMRPPSQVMRLERMGCFHQSRLSFMRVLLRRAAAEEWKFCDPDWHVNNAGVGYAVYTVQLPDRPYSLVAFAHDIPDDQRSDRVIAEAWDATFTLFDGVPTKVDIERLSQNVPIQEAGRVSKSELTLSRANKSSRLWAYAVDCLANGQQPSSEKLAETGYLMRTTAVYGSGKFGAEDRVAIKDRPEFVEPFQVEMLTVYLIRCFVVDLLDHMARVKGGDAAVALSADAKRSLGIGNSTGLGMAPFLVHHPVLLHCWIAAREAALAKVRSVGLPSDAERAVFAQHLHAALVSAQAWNSQHPMQVKKIADLCADLEKLQILFDSSKITADFWNQLYLASENKLTLEGQEQLVSLLIETYPDLVDGLSSCMSINETDYFNIDGQMDCNTLRGAIVDLYDWALRPDYDVPTAQARFWYVSEAKLEPRLGERFEEEGAELEQPLDIGRGVATLLADLPEKGRLAEFLMTHPQHRYYVRRVQRAMKFPYSEIQDNLLDKNMVPVDMLRCKLSFFGATHFDPRSDRWLRICMFQDAPFPDQLSIKNCWTHTELRA